MLQIYYNTIVGNYSVWAVKYTTVVIVLRVCELAKNITLVLVINVWAC